MSTLATIAYVASVHQSGAGTTSGINTTGATLLVACVSCQTSAHAPTDSKSNAWTLLTGNSFSGNGWSGIYYCASPIVGSGHTFTPNGTFPGGDFLAFSNVSSSPIDQYILGIYTGTSPANAGSITPTKNNELIIAFAGGQSWTSISIGSGFILDAQNYQSGVDYGYAAAYLIQTTTAAVNPNWTFSGSGGQAIIPMIASFQAGIIPYFAGDDGGLLYSDYEIW
jgi:hypothetical protein